MDESCTSEEQRAKTVTILGSSRDSKDLEPYAAAAGQLAHDLVAGGRNVLTGCGRKGIMGAAFEGADRAVVRIGTANVTGSSAEPAPSRNRGENRVILIKPPWEEPDLARCRAIGSAGSEAERIPLFMRCSRTFVVFPGGAATLQEIAALVAFNRYAAKPEDRVRVILVDATFYAGLIAQYREQERMGTLGSPLEGLFEVAPSPTALDDLSR